ncbi:hypothetical protein vseg_008131 [Gypsophila vaccaria]
MATLKGQKKVISDNNLLQPQYGVDLFINNRTPLDLTLDRVFTWSGAPTNPGFPGSIQADGETQVTYIRGINDGSIAAIVYTGGNESDAYSYVLAWDAPVDNTPTPNRVYVNCGPKSVIDCYTFETIRQYLNVSGVHSEARDILSRTTTSADISDLNPNIATVAAGFGILP